MFGSDAGAPQTRGPGPARSVVPSMVPTPSPSPDGVSLLSEDDPWAAYVRIVVEIRRTPRELLVVRAAPAGEEAPWPWPGTGPVHVMTAWDPGDERPGAEANQRRQAALEEELR